MESHSICLALDGCRNLLAHPRTVGEDILGFLVPPDRWAIRSLAGVHKLSLTIARRFDVGRRLIVFLICPAMQATLRESPIWKLP
jgi:hypothetical protein